MKFKVGDKVRMVSVSSFAIPLGSIGLVEKVFDEASGVVVDFGDTPSCRGEALGSGWPMHEGELEHER
jgi:hypothetical protein